MESSMRHRTNGMQNGDVTPPAASSEAEDGYDTSTAVDSSKVLDYLSRTGEQAILATSMQTNGF